MFNKSLKSELALAKSEVERLETQLSIERQRYAELTEVLRSSAANTPFVVDFKLLNVVSISRVAQYKNLYTVVEYAVWTNTGTVIRELRYTCSDALHHDLVVQFRKYLQIQ